MISKTRIGKDFNVIWSVFKIVNGQRQPYELEGKNVMLILVSPYGSQAPVEGWTAIGNVVQWTFRGKDQKFVGTYRLILVENAGSYGMVTVDSCDAFALVAHSCEESGGDASTVVIESIQLESEVTLTPLRGPQGEQGPVGPAGPSYDDTEIQNKLTELSEEIGNTKITFRNREYQQVPKIVVGEEIEITLNMVATQGRIITFFAKTSISDSDYQSLGSIASVGGKLSVKANREINYIRAYNDNIDAFPSAITLVSSNSLVGNLQKLETKVEDLEQVASQIEDINNYIGENEYSFSDSQYIPLHIKQGAEYKITALEVQNDRIISFFAKTETSDSTYQRLGNLRQGESAIFVADREINYVRAYNDNAGAWPVKMLLQSTEGISYRLSDLQNSNIIPCMYNPSINWSKETLNVLDIGNSYTGDCHTYLPNIIVASGAEVNLNLYKAIRSSGSFKTWVDCYNNKDNSTYSVSKTYGDSLGIDGSGAANNGETFRNALAVKWDVILIHQVSNFATDYDSWKTQSASGYLKEFIQILRQTNPQATIGFLMVHSYRSNYSGNTEKSSELRWVNIAEATKRIVREYGIDFVIPYGTAVQNLRASSLNDDYEFSEDGTHLGAGMGDYVAACCYYQSVVAPINGVSIIGNSYRVTSLTEGSGKMNVTDETAPIAQRAALLATCNMWEVVNPEDYNL